jgi:hypothetical protein
VTFRCDSRWSRFDPNPAAASPSRQAVCGLPHRCRLWPVPAFSSRRSPSVDALSRRSLRPASRRLCEVRGRCIAATRLHRTARGTTQRILPRERLAIFRHKVCEITAWARRDDARQRRKPRLFGQHRRLGLFPALTGDEAQPSAADVLARAP